MTQATLTVEVTEKAKNKLLELGLDEERFLRLGVRPGGCSGMKYDAVIDDEMEDGDQVVYQSDALKVVADGTTVQYLDGLNIDYSDDLVQSGFVLSNPNAQKSCGCGASFGGTNGPEAGAGCAGGGCG